MKSLKAILVTAMAVLALAGCASGSQKARVPADKPGAAATASKAASENAKPTGVMARNYSTGAMEMTPYLWVAPVVSEEAKDNRMFNEVGDSIPKLETLDRKAFLEKAKKAKYSDYYFRFGYGYPISLFEIYTDTQKLVLRELDAFEKFEESPSGKYVLLLADRGRYVFEVATGKRVPIQAPAGWLPQGWWNRDGEDVFYVEKREPFGGNPLDYYRSEIFAKWKRDGRIGAATMDGELLWERECVGCSIFLGIASSDMSQRLVGGGGLKIIDSHGKKSAEWSTTENKKREEKFGPMAGITQMAHAIYSGWTFGQFIPTIFSPNGKSVTLPEPLPFHAYEFVAEEHESELNINFRSQDGQEVTLEIPGPE